MGSFRCYLAGSFAPFGPYGDWRDFVKEQVRGVDWYDPRIETQQGAIATFVSQDLAGVEQSGVVFMFVTGIGDVGAAIECAHGNAKGKLVVLCIKEGVPIVHPFLLGIARRVLIGMEAGVAYLRNLAEAGLDREFDAIYKTLAELKQ